MARSLFRFGRADSCLAARRGPHISGEQLTAPFLIHSRMLLSWSRRKLDICSIRTISEKNTCNSMMPSTSYSTILRKCSNHTGSSACHTREHAQHCHPSLRPHCQLHDSAILRHVQHYAIHAIHNMVSRGGVAWAERLATPEVARALMQIADERAVQPSMREAAAAALAHALHASPQLCAYVLAASSWHFFIAGALPISWL